MQFCLVPALPYLFVCCESVGLCGRQMNINWVSEAWDAKYILMPIVRLKSLKHQSLLLYQLLSKIFFLIWGKYFRHQSLRHRRDGKIGRARVVWMDQVPLCFCKSNWQGSTNFPLITGYIIVHSRFKQQMKSSEASRIMIRPSSVIMSLTTTTKN